MNTVTAKRLRIHGRVQGVGYRESMRREAEKLSVAGWVRNCNDGTVEALMCGEESAIVQIVNWARTGPRFSRVERILISEDAPVADSTFAVAFTE